jgi:hypothetical protein
MTSTLPLRRSHLVHRASIDEQVGPEIGGSTRSKGGRVRKFHAFAEM